MSNSKAKDGKIVQIDEERPHDALGNMTPAKYLENYAENSTFELST